MLHSLCEHTSSIVGLVTSKRTSGLHVVKEKASFETMLICLFRQQDYTYHRCSQSKFDMRLYAYNDLPLPKAK